MEGWLVVGAFIAGMIVLARFLARRDRHGHWDKEGFGENRPQPGLQFRPLEVPPKPPFD